MPMWIVTVENTDKERGVSFLVNRHPGSAHSAEVSIDSDVPFDRTLAEFLVGVDNDDVCVLRSMMRGLAEDLGYEEEGDDKYEDAEELGVESGQRLFGHDGYDGEDADSKDDGEDGES